MDHLLWSRFRRQNKARIQQATTAAIMGHVEAIIISMENHELLLIAKPRGNGCLSVHILFM